MVAAIGTRESKMSQNLHEEQLIKGYFLGDLTDSEQDWVQERLFTDKDFFETLLLIEGELVDAYALGLLSEPERSKLEHGFLMSPHQYRNVKFVETLERYISNTQHGSEPRGVTEARASQSTRLDSQLAQANSLVANRREATDSKQKESYYWERLLGEAHANRDLILSLIGKNWLGLQLLLRLRAASPATRTVLSRSVDCDDADLSAALCRLTKCGLVNEIEGEFSCSWFGSEILRKLEKISGSPLQP